MAKIAARYNILVQNLTCQQGVCANMCISGYYHVPTPKSILGDPCGLCVVVVNVFAFLFEEEGSEGTLGKHILSHQLAVYIPNTCTFLRHRPTILSASCAWATLKSGTNISIAVKVFG